MKLQLRIIINWPGSLNYKFVSNIFSRTSKARLPKVPVLKSYSLHIKDSTLVGQSGKSDIQLSGLGINQNHAEVSVKHDESGAWVIVTPLEGAR